MYNIKIFFKVTIYPLAIKKTHDGRKFHENTGLRGQQHKVQHTV